MGMPEGKRAGAAIVGVSYLDEIEETNLRAHRALQLVQEFRADLTPGPEEDDQDVDASAVVRRLDAIIRAFQGEK